MKFIAKFSILSVMFVAALCMPQNDRREETTPHANIATELSPPIQNDQNNNQQVATAANNKDKNNQGDLAFNSYGFLQTVRKEWKCANGQCSEHVTKCKNGKCESVENRFKAEGYQPEIPQLAPIPFPTFNFAELFNFAFPKFDFNSFFNFDNFGLMDSVIDTKNQDFYFTDAKFITSKCKDRQCVVNVKNCTNGKCNENSETRSF